MTRFSKKITVVAAVGLAMLMSLVLLGAKNADEVVLVKPASIERQVVARATVVAANGVARVATPPGTVDEVRVQVGDVVKKGAILAVVASVEVSARGEATPVRREVAAPIGGTVLAVHAFVGDVGARPLVEIASVDDLEVRVEVDVTHAQHVVANAEVVLRPLGGGAEIARGTIARVAPRVGPRTIGLSDARIRAEGQVVAAWVPIAASAGVTLPAGMTLGAELEAVLVLPKEHVEAAVPHAAVTIVDGHARVRTPGRYFTDERRVRLGRSDGEYVELLDVTPGTEVLIP